MGLSGSKKRLGRRRFFAQQARATGYHSYNAAHEDEEIRRERRAGIVTSRGENHAWKNLRKLPKGTGKGAYCIKVEKPLLHWNTDAITGSETRTLRCFTKKKEALKHLRALVGSTPQDYDSPRYFVGSRSRRWNAKERKYPRGRHRSVLPKAEEFMRPSSPDDLPF